MIFLLHFYFQVIWIIRFKVMAPNKSGLLAPTHENLDSTASTGQLEQKMTLFAIFRDVTGGTDTRKIVKNRSHIAKFGCGSGAILVILFKKIGYFFSKIRKKWKKWKKNILKIINITHSIYAFMYVLKKEEKIWKNFKKIFFPISVNIQNSSGTTVTVTLAVTVKNFSWGNVAKMKWHSPNICRSRQKKFGQHSQC